MKILALLFALAVPLLAGRAGEYDWTAPDLAKDCEVSLRLWIPDNLKTVREILVLVPGRNGDGRGMAADPEWRALAERAPCALLACKMTGDFYQSADTWSGQVLLHGLRQLGAMSCHPELERASLLFFGHSAGAHFTASFLGWRPDRIAGFAIVNGGHDRWSATAVKARIPALWVLGEDDSDTVREAMADGFTKGRRQGGPWVFAIQPGAGHELGKARPLILAFFDTIFQARRTSGANSPAWTGDLRTHEITPARGESPDGSLNAWLPDESFAKIWKEFVTGEPVQP